MESYSAFFVFGSVFLLKFIVCIKTFHIFVLELLKL